MFHFIYTIILQEGSKLGIIPKFGPRLKMPIVNCDGMKESKFQIVLQNSVEIRRILYSDFQAFKYFISRINHNSGKDSNFSSLIFHQSSFFRV